MPSPAARIRVSFLQELLSHGELVRKESSRFDYKSSRRNLDVHCFNARTGDTPDPYDSEPFRRINFSVIKNITKTRAAPLVFLI
jgi:hypothetical protein